MNRSSHRDPWVEPQLYEIDKSVNHYNDDRDDYRRSLNYRVVTDLHGLKELKPNPRPGKDRFCYNGPSNERAKLQAGHSDHGHERIPKSVTDQNPCTRDSFGAGRPYVVLALNLKHPGTRKPHNL